MSDFPLSQDAKDFVAKVFKCEPPCDSWGVCSECIDLANFQAGYNFGFRAQEARIEELESLIDEWQKQRDLFTLMNAAKNVRLWKLEEALKKYSALEGWDQGSKTGVAAYTWAKEALK